MRPFERPWHFCFLGPKALARLRVHYNHITVVLFLTGQIIFLGTPFERTIIIISFAI